MSETIEECGNCRFWRKRSDRAGEKGGGYCVRFPPSFPSELTAWNPRDRMREEYRIEPGTRLNDSWPNVHQQSWCGEFKTIPEQESKSSPNGP